MNEQDAMRGVGRLVGGSVYPWSEASVQTYAEEFMAWTGPHAGEVLDQVCRDLVARWEHDRKPSLVEVRDLWDAAMYRRNPVLPPTTNVHCDGSGWRWRDGQLWPCARCNEALAAVFDDPEKRERYQHGTAITDLDVGVERTRGGGTRFVDGHDTPVCRPWPDEVVSPAVGRRAAWKAYSEDCARDGRDPSQSRFAAWLGR